VDAPGVGLVSADRRGEREPVVPRLELDDRRVEAVLFHRGGVPAPGQGLVAQVGNTFQALDRIPSRKARGRAGAAGVLPLRLSRQAVGAAFLPAQPVAERPRIVPDDVHHGVAVVLPVAGVLPAVLAAVVDEAAGGRVVARGALAVGLGGGLVPRRPDEGAELPEGDFVHAQVVGPPDADAVLRPLVLLGQVVAVRSAHPELARRHEDQRHADRVSDPERGFGLFLFGCCSGRPPRGVAVCRLAVPGAPTQEGEACKQEQE
jgi:hypothetical protein